MATTPDPVAAYLAEVTELAGKPAELARRAAFEVVSVGEFNAAQDRLAERAPALAAAVEAVLALADGMAAERDSYSALTEDRAWVRNECGEKFRAAISSALLGGTGEH